jgi:hypothetical protein
MGLEGKASRGMTSNSTREFGCPLSEVDRLDAAQVLAKSWADSLGPDDDDPGQPEQIAPFSLQFPQFGDCGWISSSTYILRHSRISITMEIYTEVPAASTREALRQLGERLG